MANDPTLGWDQPAARRAFDALQTPGLVVDMARVRHNIRRVVAWFDGDTDRWRPHVKTLKIPQVMARLSSSGVNAFKAATTREVDALLGVTPDADVLLAHPLRGPGLDRLVALARRHPGARVAVLCEEPDVAAGLPEPLGCFVDVNSGMNRTGIPLECGETIRAVAVAAGRRFRGVHAYEGHVLGELAERRRAARRIHDRTCDLVRRLAAAGVVVPEVVTSGTPGFVPALEHDGLAGLEAVHRVSPGTVVYHDLRSATTLEELGDLLPAALVATRVVSRPADDVVTCDAGSKALSVDVDGPCAAVVGRPDLEVSVPSEEHLPLRVTGGDVPEPGAILLLVPAHVCPTVNLAERALLTDGDAVLGVVDVSARAHELDGA